VEADGWVHHLPHVRARDAALNQTAAAEGFTVLHFSSKEIKADPAAIGRVVAAFVRRAEKTDAAPS
jgi:very-short-patch-repair endonuclease